PAANRHKGAKRIDSFLRLLCLLRLEYFDWSGSQPQAKNHRVTGRIPRSGCFSEEVLHAWIRSCRFSSVSVTKPIREAGSRSNQECSRASRSTLLSIPVQGFGRTPGAAEQPASAGTGSTDREDQHQTSASPRLRGNKQS